MMKRNLIFLLVLFGGIFSNSTNATQTNNTIFWGMLELVPASAAELEGIPRISYIDYRALNAARSGVPTYESWADWNADFENDTNDIRLWFANRMRIQSGDPYLVEYIRALGEMPIVMGFDVFNIDRSLVYGSPPGIGSIYAGDFNADAVLTAHTARDYTSIVMDEIIVWCSAVGCDQGKHRDMNNLNNANIFGGHYAQQHPFVLVPGYIFTSSELNRLEDMIATYQREQSSILTVPSYAALAEAITQGEGILIQAQIFSTADIGFRPLDASMRVPYTKLLENYGTLAPYELAIIADRQEGIDQVAIVALAYRDEATATQAAEELTSRIAGFSRVSLLNFTPIIEEDFISGVMDTPTVYFSETTGLWVAIASVRYPIPDNSLYDTETGMPVAEGAEGRFRQSGYVLRFWMDELRLASFTPLLIEISYE